MSAPKKRKSKPQKNTPKKTPQKSMNRNKRNNRRRQNKKGHQKGKTQTNLSYGIAILLLGLIASLFVYFRSVQHTQILPESLSSTSDTSTSSNTNLPPKKPRDLSNVQLKFDHQYLSANSLLTQSRTDTAAPIPLLFNAKVLQQWSHDTADFTQGFEVLNIDAKGALHILESTGLYKESKLKVLTLDRDGHATVTKSVSLKDGDFGEGCTVMVDEGGKGLVYQLTWKERRVLVWDAESLQLERTLALPKVMKEGWGLYFDYASDEFIATDGSTELFFVDPRDFSVTRQMTVRFHNSDRDGIDNKVINLKNLNEVEVVNGWIVANVWYNTNLYIISPYNGFVYGIIECWKIFPVEVKRANQRHAVLNGIAFDYQNERLIITGNNWPKVFAIELPAFMKDRSASEQ